MLLRNKLPLRLPLTHCPESCSGPAQVKGVPPIVLMNFVESVKVFLSFSQERLPSVDKITGVENLA